MHRAEEVFGIGFAADMADTTVRTLQYYDRIGLLVARRSPDGRRGYDLALLERLHHIRLMSELGLNLERIGELLDERRDAPSWEVYAEQAAMLEMAELRLRCQRAVAVGLADVLRRHPAAKVPAEALRSLMNFEDTLLAYDSVEPVRPIEDPSEELVAQVTEIYLKWKTLAIRALVLCGNGVEPTSDSGALLGAEWQAYLDFALSTGAAGDLAKSSQGIADRWPEADRDLYRATDDYLNACHAYHLSGGPS